MGKSHFSSLDIAIATFSLFTYLIDVGTDIATGTHYFLVGKNLFGWLTAAFVLVPATLMSVFSLTWHVHDKTLKPLIVLLHILPLAPVQRYARVIQLGLMSRKTHKVVHTQRALRAQNDVSILRLIEAFMESAPQLLIQLYIMITSRTVNWFTGLAAGSSLLSLSWAMTAYSDSLRKAHSSRYQHRLPRLIWHFGWQFFMTTSRIAAFVFLASIINQWLFAVIGFHWLLAFVWISFKGTDFGSGLCEKWMFRVVCAFIYIFVFLNLNDGVSRWRITAFYTITFLENAAMVAVYMASADGGNWMTLSSVTVFGGFILGLICMLVYYGFFHPSGRRIKFAKPFQSRSRMFSMSRTSDMFSPESGVQVFSIESPTMAVSSIKGSNGHPIQQTRSPKVCNIDSRPDRVSHRLSHASAHSESSQQHLQKVWQSGIESSSDSSSLSSLVSDEPLTSKLEKRPSSRISNNSDNSETSDNCLLPPLTRNDLSKSSEAVPKVQIKESVLMKKNFSGEVSGSDSVNIHSNTDSPTLSRGSWARSSDYKPSQVEEFVTLVFDDSSSTDRRGSDASSYSSRPKSLSPLDVVSLWQDVHGRLRQTIAATIAAATGTSSSNEGTPNRRSSGSQNTTLSSQDENLSSISQNSVFLENHSGYGDRNDAGALQNGSIGCGRQREALCSLPDILEAVESEAISDISGSETNYVNMAIQNIHNSKTPHKEEAQNSISPEQHIKRDTEVNAIQSPYPEDSTLTASKLLMEDTNSYLRPLYSGQRNNDVRSSPMTGEKNEISARSPSLPGQEFSEDWPKGAESRKNPSPFTDQELVSVMAKSLQSYMGYSTPTASTSREREGLALTIDDLRFSPESTLEEREGNMVRTRSNSSLFHDSDNSSPVSSASKLQRQAEANRGCEELSPNALRILADLPPRFKDTLAIHGISNRQALDILREAYARSLSATPQVGNHQSIQSSRPGRSRDDREEVTSSRLMAKKNIECHDLNRPPKHERSLSSLQGRSERYDENTPCELKGDITLFDSIAWQKSKLKANRSKGHVRASKSNTKKLSVHGTSFQVENYSSSPGRPGTFEVSAADERSEHYVKGKYRPPLCEVQENIYSRNFDQDRRVSFETDSKKEQIEALTKQGGQRLKRLSLYDEDEIEFLRKEIMRHDRRRSHQESDFFNLQVRDPQKSSRKRYSSVSQPNLRSPRSVSPRKKALPVLEGTRINRDRLNDNPDHSHHTSTRSPHHHYSLNHTEDYDSIPDQELENSASHVLDYFSHALDSRNSRFPHKPVPQQRKNKHFSQPDLQIHGSMSHQRSSNAKHF